MAEELKNSANCSTVNLKLIAQSHGSASEAAYMPYISAEEGAEGGSTTVASGGKGAKGGGEQKSGSAEFTCGQTAAFTGGRFAGILTREQAVALNLVQNVTRLAVINAQYGGDNYTVGLKSVSCRASVDAGGDVPALKVRLRALANVQSADAAPSAEGSANTHLVKEEVLRAAEDIIKERMASLVGFCRQNDCDLFYAKKLLYQHNYDKYVLFKEDLLSVMTEDFDIQIKSVR